MSNLYSISDLHFRSVSPLVHESAQIQVTVHCIVRELFLVDVVLGVFEGEVNPVQSIKHLHILLEKLGVDVTLDNIMSHDVLQLHDELVHHLLRHDGKELDDDRVLGELLILTAFLRYSLS